MDNQVHLSRRLALKLAGAGVIAASVSSRMPLGTLAQNATPVPESGVLAALGLPEIKVTITDSSYEGVGGELEAGTYFVTVSNTMTESGQVAILQLPEGMTSDDFMSMLGGGGTPAAGDEMATPIAEESGGDEPPDWFYTVSMPGGVGLGPGQKGQFVITLQPGNYIVWGEDPSAPQHPVDLLVTGGAATPMAGVSSMPSADLTITEVESDQGFAFEFEGGLSSGPQVIAVTNDSAQPHFVEIDQLPEGTTKADLDAFMASFMTGTPTSGGISENDIQPVYFIGTQSSGTTQWHEVSLEPGTYAAFCWIPDIARGGAPHAVEGMYDVLTVGEGMSTPTS